MSEENKALVQRSWEMEGPEDLDEFYPPDVVWHMPEQELRGIEEAKQYVSSFLGAFPDVSFSVEDLIAEGDKVVSRFTARGTHLRFGRTSAIDSREGHSDFGFSAPIPLLSHSARRAPAGRRPRRGQPVLRATGSSRAIPV